MRWLLEFDQARRVIATLVLVSWSAAAPVLEAADSRDGFSGNAEGGPIEGQAVCKRGQESCDQLRVQAERNAQGEPIPTRPDREIMGKDGAAMLLIPAGDFMMGSADGREDEQPLHRVWLDAFYLDKYEVTNSLFQKFVSETGYETTADRQGRAAGITAEGGWEIITGASWLRPEGTETVFESNRGEHPVVSISWYDADAYCRWVGKRLPTEAEFEYASRAGTRTVYWWGDGNPGSRLVANIADESARRRFPDLPVMAGYDDGYERTAPVGSFEPNPWGLYDMIGNVWEWTEDWYAEDYYRNSPKRNPVGPRSGEYKVLRGGSWHNGPLGARAGYRRSSQPAYRYDHIGFRCAMTP